MNTIEQSDLKLISYCGFYCGACPKYIKKECLGCKGDSSECAIGFRACKVRPCCIENGYSSCAECEKFDSVKECQIYNPILVRFGQFITRTSRRKGIEMIKEKGAESFLIFMMENRKVTMKR
ncbi:MAG TPA: DUF3795 domain-containing protein [Paludibacter sp.]